VRAGKVFVDDSPVFALFGENVRAASVDFAAAPELNSPVKRGDGNPTVHGHVGLFEAIGELRSALQVVVKGLAKSAQAANPFMLGGRETHKPTVKHLKGAAQVVVIDGPDLGTFEL
jgi:hypothetical protein